MTYKSKLAVSRTELASLAAMFGPPQAASTIRYAARFDKPPKRVDAMPDEAWHPATRLTAPSRRGTSNANDRGSAEDRRRRKRFLLDTFGDGVTTRCSFCKCVLVFETLTVDRFPIPGRAGGRYTRDNIRPACDPCNTRDQGKAGLLAIAGEPPAPVTPGTSGQPGRGKPVLVGSGHVS